MKRALTATLLAAIILPGCKAPTQETANQDDGEHEMYNSRRVDYPFDRKMTFHSRWQACRWVVDVQDTDDKGVKGKRRSIDHGGVMDSIFVPFVDGRRAWVTQTSCGPVEVHNR